jgi:ATP-binding cassette subfamily D (ALD) long-chain fatty acid import protein
MTISHRPALFKYHRFLLRLTGNNGEWEWETIGTREQLQSVEKELASLKSKLSEVDGLKSRLTQIDQELSLKLD